MVPDSQAPRHRAFLCGSHSTTTQSLGLGSLLTLTISDDFAHWLQQVKRFGRIRSSQRVQDNVNT